MMARWIWFLPLSLLALGAGIWGFKWGWIAATITETDVITTYAHQYLDEAGSGASITDCTARPGKQPEVWIIVRCQHKNGRVFVYPADRFGRLLEGVDAPHQRNVTKA